MQSVIAIRKQRGTSLMLSLVFMVGMFAAIGMATDSGHWLVNKTRLQNALDATALSAAIAVNGDPSKNTGNAVTAGKATFDLFKAGPGNNELSSVDSNQLTFEFSKTLNPWNAGSNPPYFVRVSTSALSIAPIFIQVLPAFANPVNISAVSTAGAAGDNCNLVPFVLCAQVNPSIDENCDDDTTIYDAATNTVSPGQDGFKDCFGYNVGQKIDIVQACNGGNNCDTDTSLETGNFNLLNIGQPGANVIGDALQGTRNICGGLGNNLDTQPGYAWGQIRDGINARFNQDTNTTIYASPTVATDPSAHDQYLTSNTGNSRRELAVTIGDCTGLQTGNSLIPRVGIACSFLTNESPQGGADKIVSIEFVKSCQINTSFSPTNSVLNGPYKIVIFKSAGSGSS